MKKPLNDEFKQIFIDKNKHNSSLFYIISMFIHNKKSNET